MRGNRVILVAVGAGVVIAVVAAIASEAARVPMGVFTRDIHSLSTSRGVDLPHYAGSLSMLTIMIWTAGSALAFAAAAVVRSRRSWLLVLGGLLFVIAADDALMLHEGLGVPEIAFVAAYGAVAAWLAFRSIVHLRDGSALAILIGGAALALSAVFDLWVTDPYLLEDHLKLIGALVLLTIGPTMIAAALAELAVGPVADHRRAPRDRRDERDVQDAVRRAGRGAQPDARVPRPAGLTRGRGPTVRRSRARGPRRPAGS